MRKIFVLFWQVANRNMQKQYSNETGGTGEQNESTDNLSDANEALAVWLIWLDEFQNEYNF